MKTFVIGFSKTATQAFHHLFLANGLSSFHGPEWDPDAFDCFSGSGNLNDFRTLADNYPDARFILNTRPPRDWLIDQFDPGTLASTALAYRWLESRQQHYSGVLSYFLHERARLLVVDISQPKWQAFVAQWLGLKIRDVGQVNVSASHRDAAAIATTALRSYPDRFSVKPYTNNVPGGYIS